MARVSFKRIQLGVAGLALVIGMVLVGTWAIEPSLGSEETTLSNEMVVETQPAEPLSEIGAAPGVPVEPEPAPVDPIPIPIDPTTEELIVGETAPPPSE